MGSLIISDAPFFPRSSSRLITASVVGNFQTEWERNERHHAIAPITSAASSSAGSGFDPEATAAVIGGQSRKRRRKKKDFFCH